MAKGPFKPPISSWLLPSLPGSLIHLFPILAIHHSAPCLLLPRTWAFSTHIVSAQGRVLKPKCFSFRMCSKFSASPLRASRSFQLLRDCISPEPPWPHRFSEVFYLSIQSFPTSTSMTLTLTLMCSFPTQSCWQSRVNKFFSLPSLPFLNFVNFDNFII